MKCERMSLESEGPIHKRGKGSDPNYTTDSHNNEKYDCEIYNKGIKDRWKRERFYE
jgi:hypothetical protein